MKPRINHSVGISSRVTRRAKVKEYEIRIKEEDITDSDQILLPEPEFQKSNKSKPE